MADSSPLISMVEAPWQIHGAYIEKAAINGQTIAIALPLLMLKRAI